jgi:site-specific DNA-methyltransferase (adenine-specific)
MQEQIEQTKRHMTGDNYSAQIDAVVIPPTNTIENIDCMAMLKKCPDKHFDLAIVDPPYGVDEKFKGGKTGKMNFNEVVNKRWDKKPGDEYFEQLFRVSKNQIIWGGNYYKLNGTRGFIIWDKLNSEDFTLAMAEYAWTSFDKLAKIYRGTSDKQNRIHPTQKPVKLYRWILTLYAKPGDLILDTHLGSGNSIVACIEGGFNYYGCEIDKEYYDAAMERIGRAFRKYELEFADEAV